MIAQGLAIDQKLNITEDKDLQAVGFQAIDFQATYDSLIFRFKSSVFESDSLIIRSDSLVSRDDSLMFLDNSLVLVGISLVSKSNGLVFDNRSETKNKKSYRLISYRFTSYW